jgi:hypothetical protein
MIKEIHSTVAHVTVNTESLGKVALTPKPSAPQAIFAQVKVPDEVAKRGVIVPPQHSSPLDRVAGIVPPQMPLAQIASKLNIR